MKDSVEPKYKENDWIVHSYHGVSHIEGIDKKSIEGKRENIFYSKSK
jgi:RNA polymerase-interacting CarD/CdnL/TRCF family regulator